MYVLACLLFCHNDLMSVAGPAATGCTGADDVVDCVGLGAAVGGTGVGAHPAMTTIAIIDMMSNNDFILHQ